VAQSLRRAAPRTHRRRRAGARLRRPEALVALAPQLDDVYDEQTLAKLDAWSSSPSAPLRARRRVAAAAFVGAIGLGLREVLEVRPRAPVIEEIEAWDADRGEPVRLLWVPGDQRATVALVRA
jgi:hypothetical protein